MRYMQDVMQCSLLVIYTKLKIIHHCRNDHMIFMTRKMIYFSGFQKSSIVYKVFVTLYSNILYLRYLIYKEAVIIANRPLGSSNEIFT